MTTYSTNSFVGLFGRNPQSLDSLRALIEGHADGLARAAEWLASDCEFFLFWRAADGRAAMLFSENEEQLLTQSLEQVMDIDNDPEGTLLGCFTYTPVDEKAKNAWSEKRGAVPSDDRPLQIGNVRIGP